MANRGWGVTASSSSSRRDSRDPLRTSAPLSRPLQARPRALTCSLDHRHNRYKHTHTNSSRLEPDSHSAVSCVEKLHSAATKPEVPFHSMRENRNDYHNSINTYESYT